MKEFEFELVQVLYFIFRLSCLRSALTALPFRVAHPQVTAHAGGALLGTVWAADVLDLLGQGLEGGVDLHVAVAHHVGVVSAVVARTEGIGCLLLNRLADEVESTSGRSRGSGRSGRSRRTLFGEDGAFTSCRHIESVGRLVETKI